MDVLHVAIENIGNIDLNGKRNATESSNADVPSNYFIENAKLLLDTNNNNNDNNNNN